MSLRRWLLRRRARLSCHQVGRVLQTYLDRELDDETAEKVAEHLEDCRRCGLEAATYRSLKASLRERSASPDPERVARLREFGARLAAGELGPDFPAPAS